MELDNKRKLEKDLIKNFGFEPTLGQQMALRQLSIFCLSLNSNEVFLLKGYAGTGKTTLIQTLVKTLPAYKRKTVLLAPTGRAAKVISQYTGKVAYTIHKHIFRPKSDSSGTPTFNLRENKATNTIYIVDEASMINDAGGDNTLASGSLLSELLEFVKNGVNCKLMLVGDTAQLPPVGTDQSPALDASYLGVHYRREPMEVELREVMRQVQDSGILQNATVLRAKQEEYDFTTPSFSTSPDVVRLVEGFEVEDALNDSFKEAGREGTAILVRSNKRAGLYNKQIRARVLWQEDEISAGDYLMVVKNNYFWLPEESKAGFIANGDIIELLQIYELNELYGYRYARVKVNMVDYPDEKPFETVLMLNTLDMPSAALPWEDSQKLYQTILEDYQDIPQKYKRIQELKKNPFYNALQVKFAYAITCHKAQGGQWENVFVEQPWLPSGEIDLDYLRWLYTAFTRAQKKVYLIGFKDEYFEE
ncbi:ATP-dependent DNA helicase [Owenweeksia hongkongensis]|uniref:ATP-dependent DNA helicase n=1 Tax=Owenweeksia hongkongensis TaxID=253245 RepID=UPI003A8D7CA3